MHKSDAIITCDRRGGEANGSGGSDLQDVACPKTGG